MIRFYTEDSNFVYKRKLACKQWLKHVANQEGCIIGELNIIFCSDKYILDINKKFLNHDYYTDIITFDYRENQTLSGDLFISIDCVRDNADFYKVEFSDELERVIVHGLLHIIGYDDHKENDIKLMREKEDNYLFLRYGKSI